MNAARLRLYLLAVATIISSFSAVFPGDSGFSSAMNNALLHQALGRGKGKQSISPSDRKEINREYTQQQLRVLRLRSRFKKGDNFPSVDDVRREIQEEISGINIDSSSSADGKDDFTKRASNEARCLALIEELELLNTIKIEKDTDFDEYLSLLRKNHENYANQLSSSTSAVSHAAIRGLAGHNGAFILNDLNVNSLGEGLLAGVTYRTMDAVGNLLQKTIEDEASELWHVVVGGGFRTLKDSLKNAYHWLFNGNNRPFDAEQLKRWQNEVNLILKELDKRAQNAQRDQSSDKSSRMRPLAAFMNDDSEKAVELAREVDPVWQRVAQGYADDFERIALRIEGFKWFYYPRSQSEEERFFMSERSDVVMLAQRLQDTLRVVRENIFLTSGTLKDLASGDVKQILPMLANEISQRFELLTGAVQSYHNLTDRKSVTGSIGSKSSSSLYRPSSSSSYSSSGYGSGLGGYGDDSRF